MFSLSLSLPHSLSLFSSPGRTVCENQVSQQTCCIFAPTVWGYRKQREIVDGMVGLQTLYMCVCVCVWKTERDRGKERVRHATQASGEDTIWPQAQKLIQHDCLKKNKNTRAWKVHTQTHACMHTHNCKWISGNCICQYGELEPLFT